MRMIGFLSVGLVLLLAFAGIASAAATVCTSDGVCPSCSDGTGYWQCSKITPGYACLPDSTSGNGVSLQNDIESKIVKTTDGTNQPKCACSNFPGYMEKNGKCVKTTCADTNGNTLQSGACSITKPNRCVDGQLVEDSAACGCPEGKQAKSDGKTCTQAVGCRWSNPPCQPNQECHYVETNLKDEGHCVAKQGCAYNTVTCTSMQYCDTSKEANGVCTTKDGCQYLNPPCHAGEVCNSATGVCEEGSGADTIGNPSTANTAVSDDFASCCCAPMAVMVSLAGLVVLRRQE